jgi:threonine dehydrogenase-like Zn-dependent dehydrogenase
MMKALRFHGQKDIRIDEVEVPTCGKGQVKVGGHDTAFQQHFS